MRTRGLSGALALALANALVTPAFAKPPAPTIFTLPVAGARQPPSAAFMQEGPINPPTAMLETEATAPTVAPSVNLAVGEPAPAYRTLGAAAKAGVNPVRALLARAGQVKPVVHSFWLRVKPFVLIGAGLILLLVIAYAAFSPRIRPPSQD